MANISGLMARLEKLENEAIPTADKNGLIVIVGREETEEEALKRSLREKGLPEDYDTRRFPLGSVFVVFISPEDALA